MDTGITEWNTATGRLANFVATPGILTRSRDMLKPFMPTLEANHLWVTGLDNTEPRFAPDPWIVTLRRIIKRNLENDVPTVLFGSSLGGMMVARAVTELRNSYEDATLNRLLSMIIVDSPADGNDLILGPLPASANPKVARMIQGFTPRLSANDNYGRALLNLFRVPPKDDEIERSEGGPTAEQIKQQAVDGLSGHSFTVWYDQLKWMLDSRLNLGDLNGLNVTYVACTANNVTVRQPQTLQKWHPHVRRVIKLPVPHASYVQAQPTWSRVLNELLAELYTS